VPTADPLEEAKAEAARYRDQLYRTAADLDNYRKRSKREVGEAEGRGRELMLKDLLPVFDNLERATAHADSVTEVQSLVDGISLVIRQFRDALGRAGIERIPTTGTAFDPAVHEAIQQIETAELEAGRVALEIQAGYRLGTKLIRPALVAVAKAPARKDEPAEPADPTE
jgi:molecular chaperone GrpE